MEQEQPPTQQQQNPSGLLLVCARSGSCFRLVLRPTSICPISPISSYKSVILVKRSFRYFARARLLRGRVPSAAPTVPRREIQQASDNPPIGSGSGLSHTTRGNNNETTPRFCFESLQLDTSQARGSEDSTWRALQMTLITNIPSGRGKVCITNICLQLEKFIIR